MKHALYGPKIMTAVVPVVFHFLISFEFGDYGLGRQLPPINSHILGYPKLSFDLGKRPEWNMIMPVKR